MSLTQKDGKRKSKLAAAVLVSVLLSNISAFAQTQHVHPQSGTTEELSHLKEKVARLEAIINKDSPSVIKPTGSNANSMPSGGMAGMGDHMQQMMQMMQGMMGSGPAMGAGGSASMAMQSGLPGFPGASHLYHIGASGYFLDHREMIGLTNDQQMGLNKIKENGLRDQGTAESAIDSLEQELWMLTASDKPELSKIESKVREIEKLKSDRRISFIKSIGEAAKVLTPQQIQILVGQSAPSTSGTNSQMPNGGGSQNGQQGSGMGTGHM